jgi:predicted homoserine dehydrogenase-like protein
VTHPAHFRVGVIGTGFVARHFCYELERRPSCRLGKVLTRRPLDRCPDFPHQAALTDSLDALIEASDVVFECTGDALYAARTIGRVLDAGKPVVTLNAEFHATIGTHFIERGRLSEAEGDQPGCLAALAEDAVATGFKPLVYGNMKAFLNRNPSPEEMRHWAERQDYSIEMVTSFTDGTKVQIEQCLVANGLGAGIAKEGLIGLATGDLEVAAVELGATADRLGHPISEYILDRGLQHGVFIVARHDERQALPLRNLKLGEGPYYVLIKDYCLVHLEAFKTIERLMQGRPPLLDNGVLPQISVASIAKRELEPGRVIERGCGSFDLRGTCVEIAARPGHVPICLASDLRLKRRVEPGQLLTMDDVELPETEALAAWQAIERRVLAAHRHARASWNGLAVARRPPLTSCPSGDAWTSRPPPSRR